MRVIGSELTQYGLVGAEDSSQFLFVHLFALAKELHFSLSSWKIFLELPFGFHINGQVCHMSAGIVEHSILQYVLQYGSAILQYIAICFLPYCCTPNEKVCRAQELGSYAQGQGHNQVKGQIVSKIVLLINYGSKFDETSQKDKA